MGKNKKRQHYIWKFYLKPWTLNGILWCKRNNDEFKASLENIGHKNYFYLTKPLNHIEQDFLVNLIKNQIPRENHFIIFQDMLLFCNFGDSSDEFTCKNGLENYHSSMECNAVPFFELIYKKDTSFFSDTDSKVQFMHFISMQYNRTKCMQERRKIAIRNFPMQPPPELIGKVDFENIFNALTFSLFTNSIGNWLYSKAKMYFLETDYEFITSDQPVINIHSGSLGSYDQVKDLELYYPVSPHLALFFTEKEFNTQKLDECITFQYNKLLFDKSYEQIYALSKETLKSFQK